MIKYLAAFCTFEYWQSRCHMLVIIACLSLACLGQMPDSSAGWVVPLPMPLAVRQKKKATKGDRRRRARRQYRQAQHAQTRQAITTDHARTTCLVPALRSLILATSAFILDPSWLILSLVPILSWFLQLLILRWSHLAHQPEVQALKSLLLIVNQALMLALITILGTQLKST